MHTIAAQGAPDSVLGCVQDINLSSSSPPVGTSGDAGAASRVSPRRVAAAGFRVAPRLLRCHAMTPMFFTSGELMACEQSRSLGVPFLPDASGMTATPSATSHPPSSAPPVSLFHRAPSPRSPSPGFLHQGQQRERRHSQCVCHARLPYIEQMRQRCRTAVRLTQCPVQSSRSPRAHGASSNTPSQVSVVARRQLCSSLSAPLSPASLPCGDHSGLASTLALQSSVRSVSPVTCQQHWSMQRRAPGAFGDGSDMDGWRRPNDEVGLPSHAGGLTQGYSHRSTPVARMGLGERSDGSDLGGAGNGADLGAEHRVVHRSIIPTPLRTPAPFSPPVVADSPTLSAATVSRSVWADSAAEPLHDSYGLFSDSQPSATRYSPHIPRQQEEGSGIHFQHWVGHPSVCHPLSVASTVSVQRVICPAAGTGGVLSTAAATPHGWVHDPLTFHSYEGGVPRASPPRSCFVLRTYFSLSSPFTTAGAGAAQLLARARPGASLTSSRQPHHPLLFTVPTSTTRVSDSSIVAPTTRAPAAGGGSASTPALVFTAMEPASVGIDATGGVDHYSDCTPPEFQVSSACRTFPDIMHGDGCGGGLARASMFHQHPFLVPRVHSSVITTSLPSSHVDTARSVEGYSHGRIAHAGSAVTKGCAVAEAVVVDSNDRHHCPHHPYSHPPERAGAGAAALGSTPASPPRTFVLQHRQASLRLPEAADELAPLSPLSAPSIACETPSYRQAGPHTDGRYGTGDAQARERSAAWNRTTKAAKEEIIMPSTNTAVLLVVPGGVSSVPAAAISAMISFAGDALSWGSDTPADAAFALMEDVVERGSGEESRIVGTGSGACSSDGGAGSAEPVMGRRTVTYFPVRKSVVAQRSAYFAALLNQDTGCCGPYVRSHPDEYVDLTDLSAVAPAGAPTGVPSTPLRRAGGAGMTYPMARKTSHMAWRPAHLRRDSAAVNDALVAPRDVEPMHAAAAAHRQRVPVYYIPSPATVACFADSSDGSCFKDDNAHSRSGAGDPAVSSSPTPSPASVCQFLHYLDTGVLPISLQLTERTGLGEQGLTAVTGLDSLQPESLCQHVAYDYAAVLWMGRYTGLSSLTSSMLKLLWFFLAVSRDVWPYWMAAVRWRVPEMQSICEAWMKQHLCAMLRATTAQGLWRGMRLDQVQVLVGLRREALEAQLLVTQTRAMPSDPSPGCITTVGGTVIETSMTSTTTTATPFFGREHTDNSRAASRLEGGWLRSERAPAERQAQLALRPPVSRAAAIGLSAEMLGYPQANPQLFCGDSSANHRGVGVPSLSCLWSAAAVPPPRVSCFDDRRVRPAAVAFPGPNQAAVASFPFRTQEPHSPFSSQTPLSPLEGVSSPVATAVDASIPLSHYGSRTGPLFVPSSSSSPVLHFWGFSGRTTMPRSATATTTRGSPSPVALTCNNLRNMDGASATGDTNHLASTASCAQMHRTFFGYRGEGGLRALPATHSSLSTVDLRQATANEQTFPQIDMTARDNPNLLHITLHQSRLTAQDFPSVFDGAHAQLRSPLPQLDGASPTATASAAYTTTSPIWATVRPTLQLLADGAWDIDGCSRLYTAATRDELEQLQAYWDRAERWQQHQHLSAMLLTENEMLERLWTWWHARTDDALHQPTEAGAQAMAEMLQNVYLDDAQSAHLFASYTRWRGV